MELVKCNNLCKEFDNQKVLKDVNLTIPKGRIIGLLGKNGMGKTTLLKLINDLLTPTSGEVLINGEKPNINSKKIISYLPERTYLDKSMKIWPTKCCNSRIKICYRRCNSNYRCRLTRTTRANTRNAKIVGTRK